jgi:signal transduction histidine kinase
LRGHEASRDIPVLLLAEERHAEQHGYALGAVDYLVKPVEAAPLRAKVEVLLTLFRRGVELRRRDAALEEALASVKLRELYMGVLGHDLRSPLGAISIAARMMLMRGSLGAEDKESVFRIARNADRMAALIRDILDYTRGQSAGGLPIARRSTDMSEICSSMIEEVTLLHADRKILFETHGEPRGSWDRERVEQVISNLLTNAITHGRGDIRVTVDGLPGEVVVRVHNGGLPIPPEQIPMLFQPFRRGASSRMGLGLGLYIVSEILRAHGGSVHVESTPERGTTFSTRWPRGIKEKQ